MTARRHRAAAIVGLLVVSTMLAARVSADPDAAKAAVAAGKEALARKDWESATAQFRRAISEDPQCFEGRLGLGDARLGAGDRAGALDTLRKSATAMEQVPSLEGADLALYTKLRKRLVEVDPDSAALDALVRKHADDLVAIGSRWLGKDPATVERAVTAALAIAPDHARAAELLAKSGQSGKGAKKSLFSGTDYAGWTWANAPNWTVAEGAMQPNIPAAAALIRTNEMVSGDFDVILEARLVEGFTANGPPHFAVLGGWTDDKHFTSLGYMRGSVYAFDKQGSDDKVFFDKRYADVAKGLDPTAWHNYELRFRPTKIIACLDGKELATLTRPKGQTEGYVTLKVQCCKCAFRRIEVVQR